MTAEDFKETVVGLGAAQLLHTYDMFNSEREKLVRSLGGHLISGDDYKKMEALTAKINVMQDEIMKRMEGNA